MSLKAFHIFFIAVSIVLSIGLGTWGIHDWLAGAGDRLLRFRLRVAGLRTQVPAQDAGDRGLSAGARRLAGVVALTAAAALLLAGPANACATCFGAEDSGLTQGMNGAILTLLGFIGFVQIGFVAMFAGFVVRSRRLKQQREKFRLIRGGTS